MDTTQAHRLTDADRDDLPPTARRLAPSPLRDIPRSAPGGFDLESLRMLMLDLQQKLAALDARVGVLHGLQSRADEQMAERLDWLEQQVSAVALTVDDLSGEADDRARRELARSLMPGRD